MSPNSCFRQISLPILVLLAAVAMLRTTDAAAQLFSTSYLVPTEDPRCMLLLMLSDTSVCDVAVNWGYTSDDKDRSADVEFYHQNIKNETCSTCAAEDITLSVAEICGGGPGLRIYYDVDFSFRNFDTLYTCEELYSWSNDFVLPLDVSAKHVTFYGYGDTRDCGTHFEHVSEAIQNDILNDAHPTNLKTLLLHSGDIVYNGGQTFEFFDSSYWENYFWQYANARRLYETIPIVTAMGNHDFHWDNHENYPKYFYTFWPRDQYDKSIGQVPYIDDDGKLVAPGNAMDDAYYSLDYGPLHIAVVNNYTDGELGNLGSCYIGSGMDASDKAQYEWLKNDLEGSDKDWKIILMHVPITSCDCSPTASDNTSSRANLMDLAATYGASLFVVGHAHYYQHAEANGITQLVLGGGGATLDSDCPKPPNPPKCDYKDSCIGSKCPGCGYHYAKFHVLDDHHLDVAITKVSDDGSTTPLWDTFTIVRDGATDATQADFIAPELLEYHTPVRFSCATEGAHRNHSWDLGDDGYTSTDEKENPLHFYPKPLESSGYHPYDVQLTVTAGTAEDGEPLTVTKTVQVYNGGQMTIDLDGLVASAAIFVSDVNKDLEVPKDFKAIASLEDAGYTMFRMPPGEYNVLVRALGYEDWTGKVTVKPGVETYVAPNPSPDSAAEGATVAFGSVPTGLPITVVGPRADVHHGTTPFYLKLCANPDDEINHCTDDTLDYTVTNGQLTIERSGDFSTEVVDPFSGTCAWCLVHDHPQQYWVDARNPLDVTDPSYGPIILRQPSDQKVRRFGSALLRVDARSGSPLTYRWFEGESGDTSRPIVGATSTVYATPRLPRGARLGTEVAASLVGPEASPHLRQAYQYWVRVYSGTEHLDSRTVTVGVTSQGPRLTLAPKASVCPESTVTLHGRGFNTDDPDENRVYFDELEAHVQGATRRSLTVTVPHRLSGRETATVRVRSDGVWSRPHEVQVLCSEGDVLSRKAAATVIPVAPKHKRPTRSKDDVPARNAPDIRPQPRQCRGSAPRQSLVPHL